MMSSAVLSTSFNRFRITSSLAEMLSSCASKASISFSILYKRAVNCVDYWNNISAELYFQQTLWMFFNQAQHTHFSSFLLSNINGSTAVFACNVQTFDKRMEKLVQVWIFGDGVTLLCCGAFCCHGLGPHSHSKWIHHLSPIMKHLYPDGNGLFQDDNASIHRAWGLLTGLMRMKMMGIICSGLNCNHISTQL